MELKYLNPQEFFFSYLANPIEGTQWHHWYWGREPKIYKLLAQEMWSTLVQSETFFIHSSHDWTKPEERYDYKKHGRDLALQQFTIDLDIYLQEIKSVLERVDFGLLSPDSLEHVSLHQREITQSDLLAQNVMKTMAAYSILCLELTLAGLIEDDEQWSILTFAYAVTAMERCRGLNQLQNPRGEIQKAVLSQLARQRAVRRHEETRLLETEVIEHWKTSINPILSNEKAALLLSRQFPLSTRTLSAYVAKAKRGILEQD